MKVAEAVARFLESQGVEHVFGVNGGANLHLIHGVYEATKIKFIPTAHEQGAAFAADAYARIRGLGVATATSGPGATNLITGIATSYYDSVPVLYITGNVATHRMGSRFGVRQYGFQETPIVDMVRPITKYAATVTDPEAVLSCLVGALSAMIAGRKGPALIDIPDDVQRMECCWWDPLTLDDFPDQTRKTSPLHMEMVAGWLKESERPLFIWGAGMRPYAAQARQVAERLGIPVASTWGAVDLLPRHHELNCGGFGTHGERRANLAVQNADLVISLGSRLDTKATGNPPHFVRGGRVVMVDIDQPELFKFKHLGRQIDLPIQSDVGAFLTALEGQPIKGYFPDWHSTIAGWSRYQSAYDVINNIDSETGEDDIIVSDTGTGIGMVCQAFPFNGRQRLIHAFNMTPMGYAIPAAIGAAFASGKPVTCIMGDGGAMMSLSELATAHRWNLPITFHLLDNKGHAMCRQTERQWFGGRYCSTDVESGLGMPSNWCEIFEAFYAEYFVHEVDPDATLAPQAKYGQPMEDADPQLPWDEFEQQMIVKPLERT